MIPAQPKDVELKIEKAVAVDEKVSIYLTAGHPTLYFCYKSKPLFNT